MAEQLLSVHDLAALTGWSPFTIYKKSAGGEIPGRITIGKNSLRFRADFL
jgi:predicted DNA-binding transcriptional regulator AlpA